MNYFSIETQFLALSRYYGLLARLPERFGMYSRGGSSKYGYRGYPIGLVANRRAIESEPSLPPEAVFLHTEFPIDSHCIRVLGMETGNAVLSDTTFEGQR